MKIFGRLCSVLMFIFLYAPIAVMIVFSFNSSRSTYIFESFSLKWYGELFSSSTTLNALKNTLILAALSAMIATLLGTLAAVGIFNMRSKLAKSAMMTVTNIPMMNPDVVTGVSMMLLFVFIGRLMGAAQNLNFYTILIAHITFNLPYVILNVLPKLRQTDKNLVEAAQDLGCTARSAFYKVVLPNISSGIVSGFIMAFTLSLDDFVISYFTNGIGFQTLPLLIYNQTTKKTVKPDIYALSSVIFFAILILLIIVNLIQARSEMKTDRNRKIGFLGRIAGKIGDWFDNTFKTPKSRVAVICSVLAVCIVLSVFAVNTLKVDNTKKYKSLFDRLSATYSTELAGTELNVYNWGEYISDGDEDTLNVIEAFETLTGIKVNYDNFDSNETMYSKLKNKAVAYDIIIPSDYMIERMRNENMLEKIDMSQITNFNYIDSKYKNLYFDENNEYSVAYNAGTVGIIYNTKIVKEPVDSWSIMWDKKYKDNILTFNNSRDCFAIAQFLLGQDINTENKADWDAAADLLIKQNDLLQGRVMDEVFNKMGGGNAAIAPYYAGDYYTMLNDNPDLAFAYPKEGFNIFVDSMCVPKGVQNYKAAMMFINFMCEPEIALANAEYICYTSPNTAVANNPEYSFYKDEILYPSDEQIEKAQYFHDFSKETREYYESLWDKVTVS